MTDTNTNDTRDRDGNKLNEGDIVLMVGPNDIAGNVATVEGVTPEGTYNIFPALGPPIAAYGAELRLFLRCDEAQAWTMATRLVEDEPDLAVELLDPVLYPLEWPRS